MLIQTSIGRILLFFTLSIWASRLPAQPAPTLGTPVDREAMATKVKAEFLYAWQGYRTYAWGHDALMPLSKKSHDWYGVSLHMSEIYGLDTMILMGLDRGR